MSYSVCKHGGKMCDGCMRCYDEKPCYEDDYSVDEYDHEDEEEEEYDD